MIALVATGWFIDRVFALKVMPFCGGGIEAVLGLQRIDVNVNVK